MAKFEVTVSVDYLIEADDAEEAERIALDNASGCDVVNTSIDGFPVCVEDDDEEIEGDEEDPE
jgi:hypothetical protein